MSNGWNQNSGWGQALLGHIASIVPAFGNILVVMNSSNSDEKNFGILKQIADVDGDGRVRFFTSLASAIDEAESNNNDVILLDSNSSHVLATGEALTKSRIHFIGMDGGHRLVQQGAKIQTTDAAAVAYVLKNTGTRNSFHNIKFIMNDTNAAALNVVQEGGEGTLYKNCSFTFGVADNLDLTTATEFLMGGDSCTFINCQFGQDTLLTSAARSVMKIDQVTSGQECKSNIFKDCTWMVSSSSADALLISMAAAGDILFTNHFIRPSFIASLDSAGGAAITKAVTTANGTTKGTIYISYPMVHGCTDIGVNGTNNDNLYVFSHVPSAADITSAQPTTS
jgi:hypothetical protein